MGKLSRSKGHNWEREVATRLNAWRPDTARAKRILIETREGNSGDLENGLGWSIQCKVGAAPPIYAAVEEAVAARKGDETPVAFIKRNAAPGRKMAEFVVLPVEAFLALLDRERHEEYECTVGGPYG